VTWTAVAVLLALVATGVASAHLGGAPACQLPCAMAGGLLAMGVTYAIGRVGAQL
jgi:VIT1/CCC1 family predicted Fe2+/Mn2+ transporter